MTALQLAREMGHAACVRALKEHAATAEAEVRAAQEAEAAAAEAQQVDRCATMTRRAARCASAIPHAVVVGLAARAQGRLAGSLHCPASCCINGCPSVWFARGARGAEPDRTATASQVTLLVSLWKFLRVCESLLTCTTLTLSPRTS